MTDRARSRRVPPALVGLVLGLVVVGLWQLFAGIDGTVEGLSEPTVPSVVVPEVAEASLDGEWSRVDLPGRSRLRNVWEVGGTLYTAGWDPGTRETVMWSSPDGGVWRQLPSVDGYFDSAVIYDMIGFDGSVVAVGTRVVRDHPVFDEVTVPAVWRSDDGQAFVPLGSLAVELWVPTDTEAPEIFVAGGFTSVEAFGTGLVVGGWEGDADPLTAVGATRGSVWLSEDGLSFARVSDLPEPFGPEGSIVRSIRSDGESLVAAGVSDGAAAIWTSNDGLEWNQAVADDELGSTAVKVSPGPSGALVLGRGVLAEGDELTDALRLWAPIGFAYQVVPPAGLESGVVENLAFGPSGLVAVGAVSLTDDSTIGAVWRSSDGTSWRRVELGEMPRESEMRAVVSGRRAVVIVGEVQGQPSVWVRGLEEGVEVVAGVGSLVAPPAWLTVFQQAEPNGSVPVTMQRAGEFLFGLSNSQWLWRSEDGDVWTLIDFESAGLGEATRIDRVVAADAGWVAVGESDGGALWFSSNGEQWGRPTLAPPCCAAAVFREGDGFVALIRDDRAEVWLRAVTVDGQVWEVDEAPVDLPVRSVEQQASIGPLGLLLGEPLEGGATVWGSLDGATWFEIGGPDGVFNNVTWSRVWDLGGEVVAAGELAGETVLYRTTDGVTWQSLALPTFESESLRVRDVGGFGDGLAVLVSYDDRPTRLLTFSGIGTQDEVPLDVGSGFSGLWSILVPNDQRLRMLGPDHGRMTIWEWVPAP